jgi:hypothetical protein
MILPPGAAAAYETQEPVPRPLRPWDQPCACVSAWRSFHLNRSVATSSELIGEVIKGIGR